MRSGSRNGSRFDDLASDPEPRISSREREVIYVTRTERDYVALTSCWSGGDGTVEEVCFGLAPSSAVVGLSRAVGCQRLAARAPLSLETTLTECGFIERPLESVRTEF